LGTGWGIGGAKAVCGDEGCGQGVAGGSTKGGDALTGADEVVEEGVGTAEDEGAHGDGSVGVGTLAALGGDVPETAVVAVAVETEKAGVPWATHALAGGDVDIGVWAAGVRDVAYVGCHGPNVLDPVVQGAVLAQVDVAVGEDDVAKGEIDGAIGLDGGRYLGLGVETVVGDGGRQGRREIDGEIDACPGLYCGRRPDGGQQDGCCNENVHFLGVKKNREGGVYKRVAGFHIYICEIIRGYLGHIIEKNVRRFLDASAITVDY
jgi:hypothetical protein